jgi:hypothetical protein
MLLLFLAEALEYLFLGQLAIIVQLYRGGQYYWRVNPQKTTDLPQVTNKHILLHRINLDMSGIRITALVVINTYCIGSCKSNY